MSNLKRVNKLLLKNGFNNIEANEKEDIIFLNGELDSWDRVVECGKLIASTRLYTHVVNDIRLKGYKPKPIKAPIVEDKALDNKEVDVLVIGGGVIGASILRELMKYNLSALLVDKEEDLAMHASGRNDGCIHVGVDLHKGSQKLEYLTKSKKILKDLCKDIDIDYHEDGQTVGFKKYLLVPAVRMYLHKKCRENQIEGMRILKGKKLRELEPNISKSVKFGAYFPHAGTICPYGFTIALAENAVLNGAEVSFKTIVRSMEMEGDTIKAVITNRGRIIPRVVINAAGVFSDIIAGMANDRFFTIHPRKGTDSIMDKGVIDKLSKTGVQIFDLSKKGKKKNTKGGGIIPTADDNTLVGPDAVEIIEREDFTTSAINVSNVLNKHHKTIESLRPSDVITYFSGVRAATYEEDFIVKRGKWCKNIIHAAGIQSPGLTCAPAIGVDVARWAADMLKASPNPGFNPKRRGIPMTRKLSDSDRDALIKENPLYGHIICRCEEISEGEIVDAIHSPIPPTTIDGIKRRVRAGMGRCQGGFCQPLVMQILARESNININDIPKKGEGRIILRESKE